MEQLQLFDTEFEYSRKPSPREEKIIREIFPDCPWLVYFLDDIVDLYPYKAWDYVGDKENVFQIVGCSSRQQSFFYCINTKDNTLHLIHQFSLFPMDIN